MGYRERSIWGTLVTTLLFCGWILIRSRQHHTIGSILGAILALIVVQIVVAILVALSSRREPVDERDRIIEYKSFRVAYYVLGVFGFTWLGWEHVIGMSEVGHIPMAILFLAILGAAEIVRLSVQVVLYRTGVGL